MDDLDWYADKEKCKGIKASLAVLRCPSDTADELSRVYDPVTAATCSYAFCQGTRGPGSKPEVVKFQNDGAFLYVTARRPSQCLDGLSTTYFLGEVVLAHLWESSNTWSYALAHADCLRTTENPLNTSPGGGGVYHRRNGAFGSHHPGGGLFLHGDAHVEFVSQSIDLRAYQAASTIADGELAR